MARDASSRDDARIMRQSRGVVRADRPLNSISSPPSYLGQLAVVDSIPYIATGVSTASDWKEITVTA